MTGEGILSMRDYFLRSARLGFGVWTPADLPLALGLWGDPEVTKLTEGPQTPAQVEARLAREIDNRERYGYQYWPLFELESGRHVGCCGLQPRSFEERICELGYQLRADAWGRGYAREAARAAIDHAFAHFDLAALFAGHDPANERSRRVLEAVGFRYTHDEIYPPSGKMEPAYLLERGRR